MFDIILYVLLAVAAVLALYTLAGMVGAYRTRKKLEKAMEDAMEEAADNIKRFYDKTVDDAASYFRTDSVWEWQGPGDKVETTSLEVKLEEDKPATKKKPAKKPVRRTTTKKKTRTRN